MRNITSLIVKIILFLVVSITCTKDPAGPDISDDLKPKGTITGYIYDMWNRPLKDVLVSVDADSAVPGVSKVNGEFTVGKVLAGTYILHFTHNRYEADSTYSITISQGVDDTLSDPVRLSYVYYMLAGRVVYNTTPVPGAGVALAGYPVSTLTDVQGHYFLDGIPKNTKIKLICAKSGIGFYTDSLIIGVSDDTTFVPDINLIGQGATVYGTVYDTSGNIVDSVVVAAVGGGLVDTTDKYGDYTLENVPSNENVRIFVPSSDQFYGSTIGFMLKDGSKSRIDIYLRPVSDLINGNGMALYVNDMIVNESISPVLLPVFPTTDVNTVIDSFTWTLTGSTKFITRKTVEPVLSISMDSLKALTARSKSKTVKVGVIAKNTRGELSEGQVFTVTITTAAPEAIAKGSAVENGPLSDTVKIKINEAAYFYGEAHDPFGGIDSVIWNFGDGSPTVLNIYDISHIYSQLDTFNAIFTAIDQDGNTAADSVVIIVEEPALGRPKNISPPDGDTLYNADTVTLMWHSVQGSGVTYDVYLDSLNFPAGILKQADITDTSAHFAVDIGTTYSWKIVAKRGNETGVGDSWRFAVVGELQILNVEPSGGYTVTISFNNEMDETSVTNIGNYEITHRLYDLSIIDAALDVTKKIVTLTSSNSQSAFQNSGDSTYYLTVKNVEDIYGNKFVNNSFTIPFTGSVPVGIANWGSIDNYTITGTVVDTIGNPIPGFLICIINGGADNIWGSDDDVYLQLLSDSNGKYTFQGMPSQPGINIDSTGNYELRKPDMYSGPFENYWFNFEIGEHPSPYTRNIILRYVVLDTKIDGYMKDNEGNVLPLQAVDECVGPHLTRDDLSCVIELPPDASDPAGKRHYNLQTGYYHIKDCLAGGTYKMFACPSFQISGYSDYEKTIYIEPGKTTTHNVTVYKLTSNNLLPIYMTTPDSGTSPSSPITFTWEKTDHRLIKSYTIGIWSQTNVDTTGGLVFPQGSPNMFYYIVPDTVLDVIIDPTTSPMTITGTIYNVITNIKLNTGEKYYWGIFAYDLLYNEANSGSPFSGEPVKGLWSFIAP